MLAGQLLLQRLVPDGHELLHLSGFKAAGVRGQLRPRRSDQAMGQGEEEGEKGESGLDCCPVFQGGETG